MLHLLPHGLSQLQVYNLELATANAYAQGNRHYHNLAHIHAMIAELIPYQACFENAKALYLAVLFHDWIYDSRRSDNEEQSAEMAKKILPQFGIDAFTIKLTCELILCTKNHQATCNDAAWLIDADLAILGASTQHYDTYAAAIRQEYNWVDEQSYQKGRQRVVLNFLQRVSIFQTSPFKERLEVTARANLQREYSNLAKL